jgi:hypothetical protein
MERQSKFTGYNIAIHAPRTYPTGTPTTYPIFTVTGVILLRALSAIVALANMAAGAKTIAVRANAIAMDNTAFDLVGAAVGTRIIVHGAAAVETSISALSASSRTTGTLPWIVGPGTIDFILTGAGGIGTVTSGLKWEMEWQPLSADATVRTAV